MSDAGCIAGQTPPVAEDAGEERRCLRVLFAEDNRADVELIRHALRQAGFDVEGDATDRLDRFSELVRQTDYDLILADYGLPGWNGMDALEILGTHRKRIPLILVTGSLGDEMAVQCIKAGACDYVLKANLERLPHAVKRALQEAAVYREREQAQESQLRISLPVARSYSWTAASTSAPLYAPP